MARTHKNLDTATLVWSLEDERIYTPNKRLWALPEGYEAVPARGYGTVRPVRYLGRWVGWYVLAANESWVDTARLDDEAAGRDWADDRALTHGC